MLLEFCGIDKSYGATHALNNVTFTLDAGIYALMGPNGAGKTTMMNILVDNITADAGSIHYNGCPAMGAEFRRKIGYMPQQQSMSGIFTAERFLYYMAALKGLSRSEADTQIHELLTLVHLEDERKKRLSAFSGGMKQRLLIAQALLGKPEILILDEPTAGLDPKERIRIRNLISKISFNRIVIFATHVVSDVEFIAKEFIFLRKGEMIERGSLSAIQTKLDGQVYETVVPEQDAQGYIDHHQVSNIFKDSDGIHVRTVSSTTPVNFPYSLVTPNLDDVYLALFGE